MPFIRSHSDESSSNWFRFKQSWSLQLPGNHSPTEDTFIYIRPLIRDTHMLTYSPYIEAHITLLYGYLSPDIWSSKFNITHVYEVQRYVKSVYGYFLNTFHFQ